MNKIVLCLILLIAISNPIIAQNAVEPATGSGTEEDPYRIENLENLYWIAASNNVVPSPSRSLRSEFSYVQTTDIDASPTRNWFSGHGWEPIFNFSGSYDGQGHFIDGLFINDSLRSNLGLFGNTYDADIYDLGLTNVDIRGDQYIGALVGIALGYHHNGTHTRISNCYSTGKVRGTLDTGGLIGFNDEGIVYFCYSKASVSSTRGYVGGLIGNNHRIAHFCYSTGPVSVSEGNSVHGLIGNKAGDVQSCFWDIETSGQTDTSSLTGATGKTSAEMKRKSTYLDAGWDFTTEWSIIPALNEGYPYLQGMNYPGAYKVIFRVNMINCPVFDPLIDTVRITGSFFDWAEPGSLPEQGLEREGESDIWQVEMLLDPGIYQYKYFYNSNWNNVEWPGEPNRSVHIESDTVFHDVWGSPGNELAHTRQAEIPADFVIYFAYPNPYNPSCVVPLNFAKSADVKAFLYDISGRIVNELYNGTLTAGSHELKIDGTNLATGIYLVKIQVNDALHIQKIVLMK